MARRLRKQAAWTSDYTCWPSPAQELLVRACFLPVAAAQTEFETWRRATDLSALDDFSRRLLPLLLRRPDTFAIDTELSELAARVRLAQWQQNRRHIEAAMSTAAGLAEAGIDCVALKGAALIQRFYGDPGLRGMGDVDLLVRRSDVVAAAQNLIENGWAADDRLTASQIGEQTRVRHAWQFTREDGEMCDLHWHPLVRCFHPDIAEHFLSGAESIAAGDRTMRVPSPADQLLHVVVHGIQWSWSAQTRWIPDAMTILGSGVAIDWLRLVRLASEARMTIRVHAALDYLRRRMDAAIPEEVLRHLAEHRVEQWEQSEHELLQKACPLGFADRVRWHTTNFRRIRPFDQIWSKKTYLAGLPSYLRLFAGVRSSAE